jgi:hypothetical protein
MDSFATHHFAPDGESLGSGQIEISQLSPRWLVVCASLLGDNGPIFEQSMGSTLERYRIKCTAGICHFSVSGAPSLYAVVIPPGNGVQGAGLLNTFINHIGASQTIQQQCANVSCFQAALAAITDWPAFIVVNWFNSEIPESDQEAIFQLALHFAAAYLQFAAVQPTVQPEVPASGRSSG